MIEVNCRVKSFKPAKPESTIKREAEPRTTPMAAIMVIKLIALLELLESK
jgi:hypothetical protein